MTDRERPADEVDGRVRRAARRRAARREHLLAAARRLFSEKGYHAASIADIIDEAEASRGTFYLYFASKREVFETLLEQMFARIEAAVDRVRVGADEDPVFGQMHRNVCRLLSVVEENRELTVILLRGATSLDDDLSEKVESFYARVLALIEGGLELGLQMKLIRECDTEILAHAILGGLKQVVMHWLAAPRRPPREEVARELLGFHLSGLLVPSAASEWRE